jgi:hypothetical protein
VVKARDTSTDPEVVGSIPTGGASCRRSVVEHRTENDRAARSRRKREEHGRFEAQRKQGWLCYRDAGMVESRDTSRQEAGMRPRSPERLFLPA